MSAQTAYKRAGDLTADDIGKGIWCAIRYLPQEEWPTGAHLEENRDLRYHWGWARITMVTHTSKVLTKVRIRDGGLIDGAYESSVQVNITTEEFQ